MRRVYFHEIEAMNLAQVEETAREIWKQSHECDCDDWGGLLDACLSRRQDLHNEAFQLTDAEFERFKVVAAMFAEKTEAVLRSARRMYTQMHELMHSGGGGDFTDFYIESSIRVVCESEILTDHYDDLITLNYDADRTPDDTFFRERFGGCHYNENMQLETTWHDWLGDKFPRLLEVPVCYALHNLFHHANYSLPDIIRINELWSEVKIVWQNIEDR